MKLPLNWALFLLTAASYVFYPVWNLPLHPAAQWGLLNLFVLLAAAALYSPLGEVSQDLSVPELKEVWPALLLAAAVCLPFWLTPIPTGSDDQSHAGPAAWVLGRAATAAGLDIRLLPLLGLPLAGLLALAGLALYKRRASLPGRGAAVLALAAAGNLWFLAERFFGAAGALGRYETVLRYPPLSKFLYLGAYLLLGVNEAAPRLVQFSFMALAALYLFRLLKLLSASPPPLLTFLLILFFPTFFNLGISAELEAGTVFFFIAAMFHFIRAAGSGEREQFLKCAFWTAAGFFYKQLPLGLMLSFIPVFAAFWLFRPERRPAWLYGLKTLLIPAAIGLPFIFLGWYFGIRHSGLRPHYFKSFEFMTLNLKVLYLTCGAPLTALLAAASAHALWRRRERELWLLLYLTAVYYLMISATETCGYIRHAQPFYLAPVLMLALFAAELTRAYPRLKVPFWSALLGLLFFQSFLARAPYQRKTAFNFRENVFPYREAVRYLRGLGIPGLKVYAPMEVEPSHFYLAKYGLAGKLVWDRTLPPNFSAETVSGNFREGGYDLLLLPYSPFSGLSVDFTAAADALKASGGFSEEKLFDYGGNKLLLLKTAGRN
ncbi:MAG: glycosyltransferase family 39 protein [Elusimicrobiales bacterium]|nr:glycosyltransferase family 39 protein [Elusimicrobiales bacterium]